MSNSIIIVEDEALIADHLAILLTELGHKVLGIADDSESLIALIQSSKPSLILLDINLSSHLDGIDLAHMIAAKFQIPFIFITSNSDAKTLERVKLTKASGYITKPFSKDQLNSSIALLSADKSKTADSSEPDAFFIKENQTLIRINYQDVIYAKANDNYTQLYTDNGRFLLSQTLKMVEHKLENYGFVRSHRSYLVNIKRVTKVAPRLLFIDKVEIPISESNRSNLLNQLNLF
jgi:DNA-binding LytR/AlgR family response regulator